FDTDGGPVTGVRDVSFTVQPGETLCVVGESGSGKSVTSLAIMRLVEFGGGRITAGSLHFTRADGETIDLASTDAATMRQIRGDEIGMIFQEPMTSLNPVFTIGRQLTDGLVTHRGLSNAAASERAIELLREVRIPEPERRLRQYPHELSGGMRQRVVIAMAMACRPRLLIADEPTTALDVTIQAEILALIDRLKRQTGMAVLFITHDMAVVAQMADRVVVMYRGDIVEEGPVDRIFADPQQDYTRALLAAVPKLGDMRGKTEPEPMRLIGTSPAQPLPPSSTQTRADPLLRVEHLTTRFPVHGGILRRTVAKVHAVEDVSFSLLRGQTMSLVGESGCGKSSCGRSILRLVEPESGDIHLDGWDVRSLGRLDLRRARRDMQMIFQDPFASLNPYRRLGAQVAEPLQNFGLASRSEIADRVATLFDRVRLPREFIRRFPHELSGGQRQRVAIARALAPNPKLIVADESVSALDVSVQAQVLNLLMELQADLGLSFLFISHDMAVVERVSHNVAVMYLGRIVEIGPRAAIFEDPRHPYTRALLAAVPIADPQLRRSSELPDYLPLSSPIFPLGTAPRPSVYDEAGPGHLVLRPE
ncbi:MAG: ABC transporter ATP-binding protein, partial [Pseudomonadota bacterium]|nr:ABC transporter ATP-binding protein [Pseudomonadota bacterium]